MIFGKKISSLSRFDRRVIAFEALLLSLAVLFIPTKLFKRQGKLPVMEREEQPAPELLKIYSVVRGAMDKATESSVWAISRTILQESHRHSFDPLLVLAVITVESRFQHTAASPDGARGMMQIQPSIAQALADQRHTVYGDRPNDEQLDLDNPITNIKLGVFYLHSLWQSFRDLKLALAAYNYGPTAIKIRLDEEEEVPQDYTLKVLSTYQGYRRGLHQSG